MPEIFTVSADLDGIAEILAHHNAEVRYNTRAHTVEVKCPGDPKEHPLSTDGEWARWGERHCVPLWHWALQHCRQPAKDGGIKAWKMDYATWRKGITAVACYTELADPFELWLPDPDTWDGKDRVETLLATLLGADNTLLTRWASVTIFAGALNRLEHPGAALHEHAILLGPQGIGKSTLLKALVPPEFYREHNFGETDKVDVEKLAGAVIVEFAEMDGATKRTVNRLKAFLTAEHTTTRLAYRRDAETYMRDWVGVGTANENPLPPDPTGHRRFAVIECRGNGHGRDITRMVTEAREQLWAEAITKRNRKTSDVWVTGRLPRDLDADQREANESHAPINEAIAARLKEKTQPGTLTQIATHVLGHQPEAGDKRQVDEIAATAKQLGWTIKRTRGEDGTRARVYHPPTQEETTP